VFPANNKKFNTANRKSNQEKGIKETSTHQKTEQQKVK